jgi:hypothetical protein
MAPSLSAPKKAMTNLRQIRQHHRNPVALAHAERIQRRGEAIDLVMQLPRR